MDLECKLGLIFAVPFNKNVQKGNCYQINGHKGGQFLAYTLLDFYLISRKQTSALAMHLVWVSGQEA